MINSEIRGNKANLGGVGYVHFDSKISIIDSIVSDNLAVIGGVVYINDEGSVIFENTVFKNNYAVQGNVVYQMNSLALSKYNNLTLINNEYKNQSTGDFTLDVFFKEMTSRIIPSNITFSIQKSSASFDKSLHITGDQSIIEVSAGSYVTCSFNISQANLTTLVKASSSSVEIKDSFFKDIITSPQKHMLDLSISSILTLKNSLFLNISGNVLKTVDTKIESIHVNYINSTTSIKSPFEFEESIISLNKWTSRHIQGGTTAVFLIDSSSANLVETSVSNLEKRAIFAVNSNIVASKTSIRNMKSRTLDGLAFYL